MGTTHTRASFAGKVGTEVISNFATITAAAIVGSTSVSGGTVEGTTTVTGAQVIASSFMRIGTDKYIINGGTTNLSASIVAEATLLVGTASIQGSLYLGDTQLWFFDSDTTATKTT